MNRDAAAFCVLIIWLLVIFFVEFNPTRPPGVCKCGVACECGDARGER